MVAHDQLVAAGLGDGSIQNWVKRARLIQKHRGVYLLAHTAAGRYADEMAAVLACRPRSMIDGHTAAYMWGYRPKPKDGIVHVAVIARKARNRTGVRVHRVNRLMKTDLRRINKVPIVSPAFALLEIAPDLSDYELELALHEAIALQRLTIADVKAVLRRYPRRAGCARLRALVEQGDPEAVRDSEAARILHRHLRRGGMPEPRIDHRIGRWKPDLFWEEAMLAVEIDGYLFHSTRPRIERDHRKDAELKVGERIEVLRFTGRMVRRELELVLISVARTYERRLPDELRAAA